MRTLKFPLGALLALAAASACTTAPTLTRHTLPLPADWQARVTSAISCPATHDGLIFIVNERNRLIALDASTSKTRWEADLGLASHSDDPVGVDAGRVFAAVNSDAGKVIAFDAASGIMLWEVALGKQYGRDEHPTARDGLVYYEATTTDGLSAVLRAANAATGATQWEAPVDSTIHTAPVLGDVLIYVGAYLWEGNTKKARRVIAFDARTGAHRWDYASDLDLSDRFALDAERLYFGADGGVVIARNAATGEPAWTARVGGLLSNSLVAADGVVYVGTTDGVLAALNAAEGALRWTVDVKSSILSDAAVHDGVVYFGANDGHLYAVNTQTGVNPLAGALTRTPAAGRSTLRASHGHHAGGRGRSAALLQHRCAVCAQVEVSAVTPLCDKRTGPCPCMSSAHGTPRATRLGSPMTARSDCRRNDGQFGLTGSDSPLR